jgi:hypothetical protein
MTLTEIVRRGESRREDLLLGCLNRINVDAFLVRIGCGLDGHMIAIEALHSIGIVNRPNGLLGFVDENGG